MTRHAPPGRFQSVDPEQIWTMPNQNRFIAIPGGASRIYFKDIIVNGSITGNDDEENNDGFVAVLTDSSGGFIRKLDLWNSAGVAPGDLRITHSIDQSMDLSGGVFLMVYAGIYSDANMGTFKGVGTLTYQFEYDA